MPFDVIDLSIPFDERYPCWWPELDPFAAEPRGTLETTNIFSRAITLNEHYGTHMDAHVHVGDSAGKPVSDLTSDRIPLTTLWGRCRAIDVSDVRGLQPGISPWIGADVALSYEHEHGQLRAGDAVLLRTGWSDSYFRPFPEGSAYIDDPWSGRVPAWPAPDAGFVQLLVDRGVRVLGMDIPTMAAPQDPFSNHQSAFRGGLTPIENLINIAAVQAGDVFAFLPLSITGGSGAPGRAVALRGVEELLP
jgi:isatin hydrolase